MHVHCMFYVHIKYMFKNRRFTLNLEPCSRQWLARALEPQLEPQLEPRASRELQLQLQAGS